MEKEVFILSRSIITGSYGNYAYYVFIILLGVCFVDISSVHSPTPLKISNSEELTGQKKKMLSPKIWLQLPHKQKL